MNNYKIGEFVYKDGINLGQYVENINDFIVADSNFLKSKLLDMGHYALAINKQNKKEQYNIFSKRTIFEKNIGSLDQFLVMNEEKDLIWKELLKEDYTIIELE